MASPDSNFQLVTDTILSIHAGHWQSYVSKVNTIKPFGLDFSDIYHSSILVSRGISFPDSNVLELGGALPPKYVFDFLKVKSWFSIEYHQYDDNQISRDTSQSLKSYPTYQYTSLGWEGFVSNNSDLHGTFDYVYSVSAFEHIYDLRNCLLSIIPFLKKGGCIYSYFTPIWSAHNGSHGFSPPQLASMGPHSHLLFDYNELSRILSSKFNVPLAESLDLSHELYRSNQLNRYTYEDFMLIFNSLNGYFSKILCQPIGLSRFSDLYPDSFVDRIHKYYPTMSNSASGFEVIFCV